MNSPRSLSGTLLLATLACVSSLPAQPTAPIKIRAVTAPSATSVSIGAVDELREIAGGKLLVNDGTSRALLLFDATLQQATTLADTLGRSPVYPRFAKLISYAGDSSLFYESDSRTLVVIDGQGKPGRVLSLPRPQDFNAMTSGGPVATDNHGHLVYQGRRSLGIAPPCRPASDASATRPNTPAATDSVAIIRADFEARTVDTVGRARTPVAAVFPVPTNDANCNLTGAKVRVNPSIPPTDSWTVTSRGAVAIVRGHDYHIDWIDADGTRRSSPKLAFDWRRLTDADKKAKIDSARHIIDSVTARGGYRLRSCAGGRSTSFTTAPADASGGGDVMVIGGARTSVSVSGAVGAAGGGSPDAPARSPDDCQTVTVTADFVPLDSMADYIAPIREDAARADLDGNVWILPATSLSAKGGLLYDVVNDRGELVERVQLPGGRVIAGFGKGGVLYLSHGDYKSGYVIEKVKVVR